MALKQRYKGILRESTDQGINTQITFTGTYEECESAIDSAEYGVRHAEYGWLKSVQMQQDEGKFYVVQYKYSTATTSSANPPVTDHSYGEKSATLTCGLIQLPLEKRENYLLCWNHYLFGPAGASVPSWFTDSRSAVSGDSQFAIGKYLSDRPDGMVVLAEPTKPGVTHYDVGTYQVTETEKFKSPDRAGNYVANKLNLISSPSNTFGINVTNWKCDSASIQWRDKGWYATLTYTGAGDDAGWDTDLYD